MDMKLGQMLPLGKLKRLGVLSFFTLAIGSSKGTISSPGTISAAEAACSDGTGTDKKAGSSRSSA